MRFSGHWTNGKAEKGFLQFKDGLPFDQNEDPLTGWRYLNPVWDRRFYPVCKHTILQSINISLFVICLCKYYKKFAFVRSF